MNTEPEVLESQSSDVTNSVETPKTEVSSKDKWLAWFIVAGSINYFGQQFKKSTADEFIVVVVAVVAGLYYYRLRQKIHIKHSGLRSVATYFALLFGSRPLDKWGKESAALASGLASSYSDFLTRTRKFQDDLKAGMTYLRSIMDANYQATMAAYGSIPQSTYSAPVMYQPVTYPTFSYPTQQRCIISPIGGGGVDLVVNCY